MVIASMKIKNSSYYFWNDIVYLDDFDCDLLKIVKRESRIDADIYFIVYIVKKPEYDINSINPLYLSIRHLLGRIEKIDGSSDRYLIIDESNKKVLNILNKLWKCVKDKIKSILKDSDKVTFGNYNILVKDWDKFQFSSDIDLPLDTLIKFHSLILVINCVIEKDNKFYPEIHLDKALYQTDIL